MLGLGHSRTTSTWGRHPERTVQVFILFVMFFFFFHSSVRFWVQHCWSWSSTFDITTLWSWVCPNYRRPKMYYTWTRLATQLMFISQIQKNSLNWSPCNHRARVKTKPSRNSSLSWSNSHLNSTETMASTLTRTSAKAWPWPKQTGTPEMQSQGS